MIKKAALHFYHMEVGLPEEYRSYEFEDLQKLRTELLEAGFSEAEVDGNGKLH